MRHRNGLALKGQLFAHMALAYLLFASANICAREAGLRRYATALGHFGKHKAFLGDNQLYLKAAIMLRVERNLKRLVREARVLSCFLAFSPPNDKDSGPGAFFSF